MNAIVQTINSAGRAFVDLALPMLIQSSVLIVILLLVDLVLRRRVRAVFRYWIWMLVLVKLLLPPSLWSPISFGSWFGETLEVPAVALEEPVEPARELASSGWLVQRPVASSARSVLPAWDDLAGEQAFLPPTEDSPVAMEPERIVTPGPESLLAAQAEPSEPTPSLTWQGLTLLAWATIAVALLLLLAQRALFVTDLVAQADPAPASLQEALEECCCRMGLTRPLVLKVSPNATSPAVCGLLKPVILIPRNLVPKLRPRDLQAVLLHELAHVRRGDLWINLLQTLLQIVYFYNPLLWMANVIIRRVREKAVDEAVLVAMGETARQYPETLVNIAKLAFRRRPHLSLRLIGVVESKSALRSRIKHMLARPIPKTAKVSLLGMTVVFLAAAVLLPMAKARPLTDRARNVVALAEQEARALNHSYIGTEHILLALARQKEAVSAKVLQSLDVDIDELRAGIDKLVRPGAESVGRRRLPETPRAKRVLEYAKEEAKALDHDYIGTEHMLLGLMREREGIAAQVLDDLGLTWRQVRAETLTFVQPGGAAPADLSGTESDGPLDIRLIGVCPDAGNELYDADGNKLGLTLPVLPVSEGPWKHDALRRDFIIEVPDHDGQLLFAPITFIRAAGSDGVLAGARVFALGDDSCSRVVSAELPVAYRGTWMGGMAREIPVRKVDLTLPYYYGARQDAICTFTGPFTVGAALKADEGRPYQLTPAKSADWRSESCIRFHLATSQPFDSGAPILVYDRQGRRHWVRGGSGRSGSQGASLTYETEAVPWDQVAAITVGEEPHEITFANVLVRYPQRPRRTHPAHWDRMARRLGLTGLSGEQLARYEFKNAQEAIAVLDVIRGTHIARATKAIVESRPPLDFDALDAPTLAMIRQAALSWLKSPSAGPRAYAVELGLAAGFREFIDPAFTLLDYRHPTDWQQTRFVREAVVSSLGRYVDRMTEADLERLRQYVVRCDDGMTLHRVFTSCLRASRRLETRDLMRELAQDDRPWLWWPAVSALLERSDEQLYWGYADLPESMKLRVIAVSRNEKPDEMMLLPEVRAMFPEVFTVETVRMCPQGWSNMRRALIEYLDRSEVVGVYMDILAVASQPETQARFTGDYGNPDRLYQFVSTILRDINLWYDVDFGQLGVFKQGVVNESLRTPTVFEQAVTEALQWYHAGEPPQPLEPVFAGRVVDTSEQPVADATVTVKERRALFDENGRESQRVVEVAEGQTGPDGRFAFADLLATRPHELRVEAKGYVTQERMHLWRLNDGQFHLSGDSEENVVVMEPPASLSGSLLGLDGKPMANATLSLWSYPEHGQDGPGAIRTDDEGRFTVGPLMSGLHVVQYRQRRQLAGVGTYEYPAALQWVHVQKGRSVKEVILDRRDSTCSLEFEIVDGHGRPLAARSVQLAIPLPSGGAPRLNILNLRDVPARSSYRIDGLPPLAGVLLVAARGQAPDRVDVQLRPRETVHAKVEFNDSAGESGPPSHRVYLTDLETPDANTVLDLATGELLSVRPAEYDEAYFSKLGKGDIAYEHVQNKNGLLCLRGARMQRRTETGTEPLAPDVTRDTFVVYFVENIPAQYEITTTEGDTYGLNVISIDPGDRGGALVEFAPVGKADLQKPFVLPDADVEATMLDLATGRLLAIPQVEGPNEIWRAIEALGQGDLVYDSQSLILVRNAASQQAHTGPMAPFKMYRIEQPLPATLTVTSAEGQAYRVTVLSADGKACTLTYTAIPADEGAGGLALRIVPKRDDLTPEVVERYGRALSEGQTRTDGPYRWIPVREGTNLPSDVVTQMHEGKTWLLVHNDEPSVMVLGQGRGLTRISRITDAMGRPAVQLEFDQAGAERLTALTRTHMHDPLAIIVDGVVVSAPTVAGPVGRVVQIVGNFTEPAIEDLIVALQRGRQAGTSAGSDAWRSVGEVIPPDANDTRTLAPGVVLDGIGQDVEGKLFVASVRDIDATGDKQYRFLLLTKDGELLEPRYYLSLERAGGKLWEKFTFDMRYDHRRIDHFRLQASPIGSTSVSPIPSAQEEIAAAAGVRPSPTKNAPPGRYALSFDGQGDYLLIPDSESLRAPDSVTVEMWIKPEFPADSLENRPGWAVLGQGCYLRTGHVTTRGYGIKLERFGSDAENTMVSYCRATGDGIACADVGGPLSDDWLGVSHTFARNDWVSAPGHPMVLGRFLIPSEDPFKGQIAEVRLWDGTISSSSSQPLTGNEPGLLACWTFEEGAGQIAYDISPNANHARLGRSIEADADDPKWIDLSETRAAQVVPDARECMLQLGLAVALYMNEHDGQLPPTLSVLEPYLSKPGVSAWLKENVAYIGKGNVKDYAATYAIVTGYEKTVHRTGERYVTFLDGHVELADAGRFQSLGVPTVKPSSSPADLLQRLVDEARSGATVTVSRGTYVTPIEITKPLVLRGESARECVIEVTADGPAVTIDTLGQGHVTIENLTIKWQRATNDRAPRPFALWVKDSNVLVRNCQFVPLGDNQRCPVAVRIDGASDVTIDDCRFSGFGYTVCYGPGSEGVVRNCVFTDPGHQGITGYENSRLHVERNIVIGSDYHGLRCTGGTLHARDNILADNRVSGVYLGNKDGGGTVIGNLMLRNGEGVAGFYQAEFGIENNVIADSITAGVGAWSTCRLSVRNNVFQDNPTALVVYAKGGQDSNIIGRNIFWQNAADANNCDLPADSIRADPRFADPNAGDFSSTVARGQGLTEPQVIRELWPRYEQAQRERLAAARLRDAAPPTSQVPMPTPSSSVLAWQRTDRYVAPDPEGFFPDDEEAGKKLDALYQALDKDRRSDAEILTTVRRGFRRTKQYRTLVLSWIGNRYIWGKAPQDPEAVEIMYHAVPMARHYAVYFGLSVLKHKTPNVLRTLADICLQGEDVGRITWGIGAQREELVGYIKPHLADPDPARRQIASVLVKHFAGEVDFEQWKRERRAEQAKVQFAGQLPKFKETLLAGDSRARREVLRTIRGNGLASILDDSFLPAFRAAATDSSPEVRRDVASTAGGRWIWAQQEQNPAAIDLVLNLASDTDRDTRYNAVYHGLSTLRDKTEPVIRRLVELALADHENNLYGRIVWGLKGPMRAAPEPFERVLAEHLEAAHANVHLAASVYLLYRDVLDKEPPSDWNLEQVTQRYPEDLFMVQFSAKAPFAPQNADVLWREFARTLPAEAAAERMPGYRNRKPFVCVAKVRGKPQAESVRRCIEDNPRLTVGQVVPLSLQIQLHNEERYGVTSFPSVAEPSEQGVEEATGPPGPIQQQINDAAPGDTITLPAGVFEERLVIDKPLTLEGAGWDKTTIMVRVDGPALAEQMQRAIQERIGGTTNESAISAVARQVRNSYTRPVVLVTGTQAVTICGIKFSCPGTRVEGSSLSLAPLRFSEATAHLTDCAVLGSVGNGIEIAGGCNVEIDNSLIAAAWGTGIVVGERTDPVSRVQIHDCDIRNCHYAGIRIGRRSHGTVIERCRISGAAWHGVRYDDASPDVLNNIIFGNARSGIYASGQTKATIANNLFYANEMTGLSCWFQNQDLVLNNTFAENKRVGLTVLGASRPTIRKNIFYAHPTGMSGGSINDDSPFATSDGVIKPEGSLFWLNEHNIQWRLDPNTTEMVTLDDGADVRRLDPAFVSVATKDFSLRADSPARRSAIGAMDLIPFASPWPLQREERAIIPDSDTRDYRQWKTR